MRRLLTTLLAAAAFADKCPERRYLRLTLALGLRSLADQSARPAPGARVGVALDSQQLVLFDAATEKLLPSATTRAHQPSMRHG